MTLKQAIRMELHLGLKKYKKCPRPKMDNEDFMMKKEFSFPDCVPFIIMVLFYDHRNEREKRSMKPNKEHFSYCLCASSFSTDMPPFEIRNTSQQEDTVSFEKICKEIYTVIHKNTK